MQGNSRFSACLVLCAGLVGCSSSRPEVEAVPLTWGFITFNSLPTQPAHRGFSAFDGSQHTYQLIALIPAASDMPTETNPDPVDPSSLVWTVDHVFVDADAYPDIRGAILLTTKRAGETKIRVRGTKRSGLQIQNAATLTISQANADERAQGDKLWNAIIEARTPAIDAGTSDCPLRPSDDAIATSSTCNDCHGNPPPITPAQTAGYTDDDLIDIFTNGHKPPGYIFTSDTLQSAEMPECAFQQFHSFNIDNDAAKRGLVWKLRSLAPRLH